jgi:hypothetical protein
MRKYFRFLLFVAAVSSVAAQDSGVAFLKISPDAASTALGDPAVVYGSTSFTALGNPALLGLHQGNRASVSQINWLFDSKMQAAAAEFQAGAFRVGIDLRVFDADEFELREGASPLPQGEFMVSNWAAGATVSAQLSSFFGESVAAPLTTGLTAGVSVRRLHEKIYNADSQGWEMDLGLAWQRERLHLAWSMKHIGEMSEFIDEAPELPLTQSFGLAFLNMHTPWAGETNLYAEFRHIRDDGSHLHFGTEWKALSALALRAGWMSSYDERSISAGFAVYWKRMSLDYAWLPFDGGLEDTHKFTFSFAL